MAQETQPYRRSLSGSIGAGMKSVFGGGGRTYYMLVHKVSSKYHKAGESQPIIVDEIELGRGSQCQVRFDDSFATVSRRHAAIVKDGDNWKLVQLSTTNSTYLNGQKIEKEWYLQNGDEIQLSTNGPKLGFIVPEGDKSKVSSIGLTARLNLFRKQALRPYKTAIWSLAAVLVLAIAGGTWKITQQDNTIAGQTKQLVAQNEELMKMKEERKLDSIQIDSVNRVIVENSLQIAQLTEDKAAAKKREQQMRSRINAMNVELADLKKQVLENTDPDVLAMLEEASKGTYYMYCSVFCDGTYKTDWSGTGFLLDDGRFVTARHCVDVLEVKPASIKKELEVANIGKVVGFPKGVVEAMNMAATHPDRVTYEFVAYTPDKTDKIDLNYSQSNQKFHMGQAKLKSVDGSFYKFYYQINEKTKDVDIMVDLNPESVIYHVTRPSHQDFAWILTNKKGKLKADPEFAKNMPAGTKLWVLGYPQGEGKGIAPRLSESSVAVAGLNEKGCIQLSNEETDGGNSGGPVFAIHDGELVVVGILSGADPLGGRGMMKDRVVPISVIGSK